jgi:hypothetical protein
VWHHPKNAIISVHGELDVVDERIPKLVSKWNKRQKFYREIGTIKK